MIVLVGAVRIAGVAEVVVLDGGGQVILMKFLERLREELMHLTRWWWWW